MRRISKTAAFMFALSLGAVAMTGCGDKKSDSESGSKETTSAVQTTGETTTAESTTASTEPTTAAKIKYEPTPEILNADLSEGLVQIGNCVFRQGGYMTIGDFITKYGKEFDMSPIKTDEYLLGKTNKTVQLTSISDPNLKISVTFENRNAGLNDHTKVTDGVIDMVSEVDKEQSATFLAKGLPFKSDMDYDKIKEFLRAQGYKQYEYYGVDYADCFSDSGNQFSIYIVSKDKNLYDYQSAFHYVFSYDSSTLKGKESYCQGWVSSSCVSDPEDADLVGEDAAADDEDDLDTDEELDEVDEDGAVGEDEGADVDFGDE